eukprot:979652-Amphidinium_carterae.1
MWQVTRVRSPLHGCDQRTARSVLILMNKGDTMWTMSQCCIPVTSWKPPQYAILLLYGAHLL